MMSNNDLIPEIKLDAEEFNLSKLVWFLQGCHTTYNLSFHLSNDNKYFTLKIQLPDYIAVNPSWLDEIQTFVKVNWVDLDWQKGKGLILTCISWKQRKAFDKENPNN